MKKVKRYRFLFLAVILFEIPFITHLDARPAYAAENDRVETFVTNLYRNCLDREPDAAGLQHWVDVLTSGKRTGADVAAGFVFSKELNKTALCNKHFVEMLYKAILGRKSVSETDPGFVHWVELLDQGITRGFVFSGFVGSAEFKAECKLAGIEPGTGDKYEDRNPAHTDICYLDAKPFVEDFVKRLYKICLDRPYDRIIIDPGYHDWVNKLSRGKVTAAQVAYGFIFSAEFRNKNLCNEHFIYYLYKAFFNRDDKKIVKDLAGFNHWREILQNGGTRGEVFNGFIGSGEFSKLCAHYNLKTGFDRNSGYANADFKPQADCPQCFYIYPLEDEVIDIVNDRDDGWWAGENRDLRYPEFYFKIQNRWPFFKKARAYSDRDDIIKVTGISRDSYYSNELTLGTMITCELIQDPERPWVKEGSGEANITIVLVDIFGQEKNFTFHVTVRKREIDYWYWD